MSENKNLKNIVVAIDPLETTQYSLNRALMMNKVLEEGVNIHLFISLEMDKLHKQHDTYDFSCDGDWFNGLVKPMVDAGIDYTSEVVWTDAWHRSMQATCKKYNADLVIISDYAKKDGSTDLSPSKWALLRASQCPVMIVHPQTNIERNTILAAVNMQTDNPRYAELNEKILGFSALLADKYKAEKHIVNGYEDGMAYPDRAKLLKETDTKQENIHVKKGGPRAIISEVAKEIDADIVVIGTLARKGVMAAMRGNKSERIIRELNCDVMVLN
ncbi:MAG: universal stress protein [Emcibacteraceae bacterium]|nr:universal stress protein [Emcibacteraceae bacterium]